MALGLPASKPIRYVDVQRRLMLHLAPGFKLTLRVERQMEIFAVRGRGNRGAHAYTGPATAAAKHKFLI